MSTAAQPSKDTSIFMPLSPLHAAARCFALAGIKVFPCLPDAKQPATPNGFHDASADVAKIDAWWTENEHYNIGLCPEDAGWAVIDLDPGSEAVWLEALRDGGGYDATYEVTTPRGGKHLYFEGSLPSTASKLADHVDTRGVGGYVLVPPSVVNGKQYEVLHDRPIAKLPDWIAARIAASGKGKARTAPGNLKMDSDLAVAQFTSHIKSDAANEGWPQIGKGSDFRTLCIINEGMDLGLSDEKIGDLLHEHWAPHFGRSWLDAKITNADKYRQNERGCDAPRPADEAFGNTPVVQKLLEKSRATDDPMSRLSGWDDWKKEPDTEWLFEGFIPQGATITVNGKSQSFKSFILVDVLYSVATGTPAFGKREPEIAGGAVYIPVEGKRGLKKKRIVALHRDRKVIPRNLMIYEKVPQLAVPEDIEKLKASLRAFNKTVAPIRAIAIDHAAGVLGGLSANDRENLQLLWRLANELIEEFGCVVLIAAHPPKSAAADEANVAGTYGFYADVDGFLQVSRKEGSRTAQIDIVKMKDEDGEGSQIFVKARLVGTGEDKKGRPQSSFVLDETSAAAVADERDTDRVTVELALEREGATSEATAIRTDDLAYAVARIGDPEFPATMTAVAGARADRLKAARALVRRVQDREDTLDLRFKAKGRTSPWKWRLLPDAERTVPPARREPPTPGTIADRKAGDL